jgi:tetratricopeptide (TPR) repeat protein
MEENHDHCDHDHCDHDHEHDHDHENEHKPKTLYKWLFSIIFIPLCLLLTSHYTSSQLSIAGSSYLGYDMYKEAIKQYKKSLFFNKKNIDSGNWLAFCYNQIDDHESAITQYSKVIEIDPSNRKALQSLGLLLGLEGKCQQAIEPLEKLRSLGPTGYSEAEGIDFYISGLRILATCYEKMGEMKKARDILIEVVKDDPKDKYSKAKLKDLESKLR